MVALAVPLTGAPKAMIIVETPGVRFDFRGLRRHAQLGHREPAAQSDCSESWVGRRSTFSHALLRVAAEDDLVASPARVRDPLTKHLSCLPTPHFPGYARSR
jgi:hypothetical protein